MVLLPLLGCVLLGALSSNAKVVHNFQECSEFFFKRREPEGMDQNAEKICQKCQGFRWSHFATLYSTHHRIPLYSAYLFNPGDPSPADRREWYIEPMLSGEGPEYMTPEPRSNIDSIKIRQAVSSDYEDSGYDRGHLNPRGFQTSYCRDATFTLTNAAPMEPCFNRVRWKQWEDQTKAFLKNLHLDKNNATAYMITGTVPHPEYRIPSDSRRVTVPSVIWTAVCVHYRTNEGRSFSFGYMGENRPDSEVRLMSVSEMNTRLGIMYRSWSAVRIFADGCSTDDQTLKERVKIEVRLPERLRIPKHQRLGLAQKRPNSDVPQRIIRIFTDLQGGECSDVDRDVQKMIQGYEAKPPCLLDTDRILNPINIFPSSPFHKLGKRDATQRPGAALRKVPEKSDVVSMTAADGTHCQSSQSYCKTSSNQFKPRCSAPCLYREESSDYWCQSGQAQIQCSPQ